MKKNVFILLGTVAFISFFSSSALHRRNHRFNRGLRLKTPYHSLTPDVLRNIHGNSTLWGGRADDVHVQDSKVHLLDDLFRSKTFQCDQIIPPKNLGNPGEELSHKTERKFKSEGNDTKIQGEKRSKRSTIAYPPGAVFVAQFSFEIPVISPQGVVIPILMEVPYEIEIPNATESIIAIGGRAHRQTFFKTMEGFFNRFGFNGEDCTLRAICERAESNILTKGLLGEVLNVILAVSSEFSGSGYIEHYKEAEYHGKTLGDCDIKYSQCPISIFHFFD